MADQNDDLEIVAEMAKAIAMVRGNVVPNDDQKGRAKEYLAAHRAMLAVMAAATGTTA